MAENTVADREIAEALIAALHGLIVAAGPPTEHGVHLVPAAEIRAMRDVLRVCERALLEVSRNGV